ncbi:MAG: patatin-like phospholipase family protein, partial [Bacteroidota bacterium]
LVVVAVPGGGIQAASWTTQVLAGLVNARPELAVEMRAISGVSGGSVGAAFYVAAFHYTRDTLASTPDTTLARLRACFGVRGDTLGEVEDRVAAIADSAAHDARASSLSAVSYGLAFRDVPRVPIALAARFGGIGSSLLDEDRGRFLEEAWARTAQSERLMLGDLARSISSGCLPAPILNTTAMETGHRVMVTPVQFDAPRALDGSLYSTTEDWPRARTLYEYLDRGGEAPPWDLRLFTAARLSATFPWVGPPARATYPDSVERQDPLTYEGHHFIDGGYHENYGISGALDFLEPVLQARLADSTDALTFDRVLLIQIRNQPTVPSGETSSTDEFGTALIGPGVGALANTFQGAAMRNDAQVHRFLARWNAALEGTAVVRTVVFEPRDPEHPSPLSWHLTASQQAAVDAQWKQQETCVDQLKTFLTASQDGVQDHSFSPECAPPNGPPAPAGLVGGSP